MVVITADMADMVVALADALVATSGMAAALAPDRSVVVASPDMAAALVGDRAEASGADRAVLLADTEVALVGTAAVGIAEGIFPTLLRHLEAGET